MRLTVSQEKRVYDNILGAIGNTPLVRLSRIGRDLPRVWGQLLQELSSR